jgi:hypothetical protein
MVVDFGGCSMDGIVAVLGFVIVLLTALLAYLVLVLRAKQQTIEGYHTWVMNHYGPDNKEAEYDEDFAKWREELR